MSLDRWLALAGIVLGIAGLILTVVVAVRVRPMPAIVTRLGALTARRKPPEPEVGTEHGPAAGAPSVPNGDHGPAAARGAGANASEVAGAADVGSGAESSVDNGTPGSGTPGSGTPGSGTPGSGTPGSGTPGSEPDDDAPDEDRGPDDELATSTVLTGVALWLAAVLGIGFATTEVEVAQIVAQVALVVSVAAIAVLVVQWRRGTARYLSWLANLFVVDAAIAATPGWLARPAYSQGRFDDLATWLPSSGSVNARLDDALKDYGAGGVAHVVVQAGGWALLIALAMYVIANIVRRARDRREPRRQGRWAASIVLVVAAVGVVCASGSAVAISIRTFGHASFATARTGATTGSDAPALALRADKRGRVSLLVGRCGNDRILAMTIDGKAIGDGIGVPHGGGVLAVPLPARPRTGPVTVKFRSTRRFDTTVVFASRPRAGRFLPLRTKDTLRAFDRPGHAC